MEQSCHRGLCLGTEIEVGDERNDIGAKSNTEHDECVLRAAAVDRISAVNTFSACESTDDTSLIGDRL